MPDTEQGTIPRPLIGAAFAACVITSLPGFTLLLSNSDVSAPDVLAFVAEMVCGSIAGVFGALQIRAQTRSSGKWIGLLPLAALATSVFVIGVLFVFKMGSGSVDSGPIIIVGIFGVLVVVAIQMAVAAFAWFLLSTWAKALDRDAASHIDPSIRASKWLGVAAIIHVAVKGATGGPTLFGFIAALLSLSLAWPKKQSLGLTLSALSIITSLISSAVTRVYFAHKHALELLPMCESGGGDRETGVIASHVRAMPDVADVMVFFRSPYGGADLSVVVVPIGGGSVPAAMRDAIVRDAMASACVVDNAGTKPIVHVEDAKYAEIPVLARVHLAPHADADEARKAITAAARDMFEMRAGNHLIRDPQSAGDDDPVTPQDAGVQLVEWKSDNEYLSTRIEQLEIGSVATMGKLEIEIVADE